MTSIRTLLTLALVSLLALGSASASAAAPKKVKAGSLNGRDLAYGYALLYDNLQRDKDVSKVFIMKSGAPELKTLITAISKECDTQIAALDQFNKADRGVELVKTDLPKAEMRARALDEKFKRETIMDGSGPIFRTRLLMSQGEAVNYALQLCNALAESEKNPQRKAWLEQAAKNWAALYAKVEQQLAKS